MGFLLRRTRSSKLLDFLAFSVIIVAMLGLLWLLPEPVSESVAGAPRVIDGDSLRVHGRNIRLLGIDAVERDQTCRRNGAEWPCGAEAARALRNRLQGKLVTCSGNEHDKHDRLLAICRIGKDDINRWLVRQGWAVSYGRYMTDEDAAKRARRGIWSGTFVAPLDWREGAR
ncbi:MAG: thermonuclease family protein [Hyphomicrobiaceae bacterium]|nr:thermonuclease family protein [Hyphomicrobiaceae bacterium]